MHFSNREQISFFPDEIMLAQAKAELGKLHNSALTLYSEIMSRFHAFEELVILPFIFVVSDAWIWIWFMFNL